MRALCETLKVSTSGYYDWCDRPLNKREQANAVFREHIGKAHRGSDETYGMPRVRAELADAEITASRKRIARLMRAMHIQGISRRRVWRVTTERNKSQLPAPDLAKRVFVAQYINELWVANMTYVPTWDGFWYLAVVTDVKKGVCVPPWALSETAMTTPWPRVSSLLWSASPLPDAAGKPRPKHAWQCSPRLKVGTTRTGATRP